MEVGDYRQFVLGNGPTTYAYNAILGEHHTMERDVIIQ